MAGVSRAAQGEVINSGGYGEWPLLSQPPKLAGDADMPGKCAIERIATIVTTGVSVCAF